MFPSFFDTGICLAGEAETGKKSAEKMLAFSRFMLCGNRNVMSCPAAFKSRTAEKPPPIIINGGVCQQWTDHVEGT
jgi:hypothetical protein